MKDDLPKLQQYIEAIDKAMNMAMEETIGYCAWCEEEYKFNEGLSGWKVLWSKLNPFKPAIKAPTLIETLMRSIELNSVYQKSSNRALADLYIDPPVGHFGASAFEAYQTLIDIGYQAAKTAISDWLETQVENRKETYNID